MFRSAPILAAGLICLGLTACAGRAPSTYDLVASRSFAATARSARFQLTVGEPTAVHALETKRILVRQGADQISYYKGVEWGDRLPRLVQARMIETFQNSGAVRAITEIGGDYTLETELRAFQIDVSGPTTAADIDIFAKLVNRSGRVVASKGFSSRVTAKTDAPADAVAALNQAFTEVMQDTTAWVATKR